jgi:DNA-binding transcriptional ArsR family regulator
VEVAGTQTSPNKSAERAGARIRPGLADVPLPEVVLDCRTVYDFLLSGCFECGELEDLLPDDRTWLTQNRAALAADLGSAECAQVCTPFVTELGRMVAFHPEIKTARDLVVAVDALSDAELLDALVGELVESPELGTITRRALDGDKAAYAELATQLSAHKGHHVLPDSFEVLPPTTRKTLHAWLPRFEKIQDRVARLIERDVSGRSKADLEADRMRFVEQATSGVRLLPEPSVHRIVLAPTYFGRPYNSLSRIGDTQLVCYPIADSALEAAGTTVPPAATVRLYRALGDDTRLRILRLLAERDRYLTELAAELELSKPTISHHLAQLRSAGLVTWNEQGNLTYYTLRRDRVQAAGPELSAFLAR